MPDSGRPPPPVDALLRHTGGFESLARGDGAFHAVTPARWLKSVSPQTQERRKNPTAGSGAGAGCASCYVESEELSAPGLPASPFRLHLHVQSLPDGRLRLHHARRGWVFGAGGDGDSGGGRGPGGVVPSAGAPQLRGAPLAATGGGQEGGHREDSLDGGDPAVGAGVPGPDAVFVSTQRLVGGARGVGRLPCLSDRDCPRPEPRRRSGSFPSAGLGPPPADGVRCPWRRYRRTADLR